MNIEKILYENQDSICLSFGKYQAIIMYGRGCNIVEFNDTSTNRKLLHFPETSDKEEFDRSVQRYGSAILFPPNRIEKGCFKRNNKFYNLKANKHPASHGILKEVPFDLVQSSVSEDCLYVKFAFNSYTNEIYHNLSWDFTCYFEYILSNEGLTQKITITNNGYTPIPTGVGFHTAIRIPSDDNTTPLDYNVKVSTGMQWELNEHTIPTGQIIPLSRDYKNIGILPLSAPISEHTTVSPFKNGFHGAIITDIKSGYNFFYKVDPIFSHWMIWNNNASDNYICIEPMSWIINAPNSNLRDELTGYRELNHLQSFNARNAMYVRS